MVRGALKPCLFQAHEKCIVFEALEKNAPPDVFERIKSVWGSEEWVKLYCSMCAKFLYAKSKNSIRVINTL